MGLIIVTGERGAGKTTFCTRLIELARSAGKSIGGVLSPRCLMAKLASTIDPHERAPPSADRFNAANRGPQRWSFHAAMVGATCVARHSCDVDRRRTGHAKFDRGELVGGTNALDAGDYRLGVVVIRLSC
jgi:molybdopterin-guanine dinucleotide biosynthesis protein